MSSNLMLTNMNKNLSNIYSTYEQITSGKKLTSVGQNPSDGTKVMKYNKQLGQLDDWSKRKKKDLQMESILGRVQKEFSTYPSATIASFSPPSISGLGMFGGFEYQLLDKGNRTPQGLYDEAIKLIG